MFGKCFIDAIAPRGSFLLLGSGGFPLGLLAGLLLGGLGLVLLPLGLVGCDVLLDQLVELLYPCFIVIDPLHQLHGFPCEVRIGVLDVLVVQFADLLVGLVDVAVLGVDLGFVLLSLVFLVRPVRSVLGGRLKIC